MPSVPSYLLTLGKKKPPRTGLRRGGEGRKPTRTQRGRARFPGEEVRAAGFPPAACPRPRRRVANHSGALAEPRPITVAPSLSPAPEAAAAPLGTGGRARGRSSGRSVRAFSREIFWAGPSARRPEVLLLRRFHFQMRFHASSQLKRVLVLLLKCLLLGPCFPEPQLSNPVSSGSRSGRCPSRLTARRERHTSPAGTSEFPPRQAPPSPRPPARPRPPTTGTSHAGWDFGVT